MLSPFSFLSLLSVLIFGVCLFQQHAELTQLRTVLAESEETQRNLGEKLKHAGKSRSELEDSFRAILDSCSDYFCVYSDGSVKLSSASFRNITASVNSFWKDHLQETYQSDFQKNVRNALHGDTVSMKVKLRKAAAGPNHRVIPLSPILDAFLDERKDAPLDLEMRPIVWDGKTAVLIHMRLRHIQAPVLDFLKTFNHEFRTPLNIIIGLSDLILGETESEPVTAEQRLRLLRQCACTLLATINSIVHQCELEWKIPTGLKHVDFDPQYEIEETAFSVKDKLLMRGNLLDLTLDTSLPEELWGNVAQFRHVIRFLILCCSEVTEHDKISLRMKATTQNERCTLEGDIEASCPALCSCSDFNSVLQLFSESEESQGSTQNYECILKFADRQAMLNLSVAREMCRLFLGDLQVKESSTMALQFQLAFSIRKHYVLKRRGNIFSDEEEFVRVDSPSYAKEELEDDMIADLSPGRKVSSVMRFKSDTQVNVFVRAHSPEFELGRRRTRTCPSSQLMFDQLPSNSGDTGEISDSPHIETRPREVFALVADDIPSNALVLSSMLTRLGVKTVVVSNGAEALNCVQTRVPDVVFMDCQMPVMDGLEATRKIREMGVHIPIVAVTANGPENEGECSEAGMDYFMSKPVRLAALSELLHTLHLK